MLAQIQAFAKMLTPTNLDPALVVSKALTLTAGNGRERREPLRCGYHRQVQVSEGAG